MDSSSSFNRIVQRLVLYGVPEKYLDYQGIVAFVKEDNSRIRGLVSSIFPTHEEVAEDNEFQECMIWIKWLMFENDPADSLENLPGGRHDICGSIWCNEDICYKCRTCEFNETSSICVSCFESGDHSGHDYSVTHYRGGCCDCGDVTKWKPEGFCSKHIHMIHPLRDEPVAKSMVPVLDALLTIWKDNLSDSISGGSENYHYANDLSGATVEMLLQLSKQSQTFRILISKNVVSSAGLLEFLIKSERLLGKNVVTKLHELLLDLLRQHSFKYEFAKEFIKYYPSLVDIIIEEEEDSLFRKYPLLSKFSMQIFSTPALTPRLVEEHNLLTILFTCLEDIFVATAGEDGRLEMAKWSYFYQITIRVVEDIKLVISHVMVPQYMFRDLLRTWFKLLSFLQGMNGSKRGTNVNDGMDHMHKIFELVRFIGNINSILVGGAFDNNDLLRQEYKVELPESAMCLAYECLRAIVNWTRFYDSTSTGSQSQQHFHLGILNVLEWPDIVYDVNTQEVSVHSPLHHFLFMLLHNILKRCGGGNFDVFESMLVGCRPHGFSSSIMEHPLQVRVFCAQVCTGMWSEDDIHSMLSAHWYLNARLSEGLESDLFLLQFCAAYAPPDLYVARILGRFGLSEYLSLNLEKSSEYEPDLVKEMLSLLIQVLQERRFCGLTIPQSLRSALVCHLASGDATYSQLRGSLPCDLLECDRFQEILNTVANHSDPTEFRT
ncbi:hypothetical protein ACFE04_011649 [Oxalis oulophora]